MKKLFLVFAIFSTVSAFAQQYSGKGSAEVYGNGGGGVILAIDGEAAELLYNALKTKSITPPYSSSKTKTVGTTQCTQNGSAYHCILSPDLKNY